MKWLPAVGATIGLVLGVGVYIMLVRWVTSMLHVRPDGADLLVAACMVGVGFIAVTLIVVVLMAAWKVLRALINELLDKL